MTIKENGSHQRAAKMRFTFFAALGVTILFVVGSVRTNSTLFSSDSLDFRGSSSDEEESPTQSSSLRAGTIQIDDSHMTWKRKGDNIRSRNYTKDECRIYMAPSAIPNAGMGLYTVIPMKHRDIIQDSDSPGVALIDPHTGPSTYMQLIVDKSWPEKKGMYDDMRFEAKHPLEMSFNFGALPNFHPYLYNIQTRQPKNLYDDSLLSRTVDPGAGAYSEYKGKMFSANRDIEAGEELFLNYGESYLDGYTELKDVARSADYKTAAKMLVQFKDELMHVRDNQLNKQDLEKLEDLVRHIHDVASVVSVRISGILPESAAKMKEVLDEAGSFEIDDLSYALAREISTYHRSVDWIKENGMCMDNIVPKTSTLAQAGNGAFARRSLSRGEIIIPYPLLHIADSDVMGTYNVYVDKHGSLVRDTSKMSGNKQLIMNYCFGHEESSLLLCPETNGILINHCSKRKGQCGKDGPNVEYRWATGWDNTQKSLKMSFNAVEAEKRVRLMSMEIVATRNIKEGEELFMDYGERWEKAWEDHVKNWAPPAIGSGFEYDESAFVLNKKTGPIESLSDMRDDHSPKGNLMTGCWYWEENDDDIESFKDDWKKLSDREILQKFSINGKHFIKKKDHYYGYMWPCSVISQDDDSSYTVRIFQSKTHDDTKWDRQNLPRLVRRFPRDSIKYFTKPYRSDQHLPGAFRHHIEIRDEIFPTHWKNLKKSPSGAFAVGDKVEENWENKGKWYNGFIAKVHDGDMYDVKFDDGGFELRVPAKRIRSSDSTLHRVGIDDFYA